MRRLIFFLALLIAAPIAATAQTTTPISMLPAAATANLTDLVPCVQLGAPNVTRKCTSAQIIALGSSSFLSLTGGAISGSTTFNGTVAISGGPLTIAPPTVTALVSGGTGYGKQQTTTFNLGNTASGIYEANLNVTTVMGNPPSGAQVWAYLDQFTTNTDSATTAAMVGRYMQSVRLAAAPNTTQWSIITEARDKTGLASSLGGKWLVQEMDLAVNGPDDAAVLGRQGLVITELNGTGSGTPGEVTCAICIFSGGTSGYGYYSTLVFGDSARDAQLDMRSVGTWSGSGSGNGFAMWLKTGLSVAFDTGGTVTLSSEGTTLFSSKAVRSPLGFYFQPSGPSITSDGQVELASVPWRLPPYTVAALPSLTAVREGSMAWASDCRESGEGPGAGGGCVVVVNSVGNWIAVWSGVAPTT